MYSTLRYKMLETVGGNMDEREYSHRLGKRKTGYLSEIANAAPNSGLKGEQTPPKAEDRLYDDLSVIDAGLAEMWMEMRM